MRKRGASTVAVVILVVIIIACVGLLVYQVSTKASPAPPKRTSAVTVTLKCTAQGCGWTKIVSETEPAGMERGPGIGGTGELIKCPKCAKFSVGIVRE